MRGDGPAVLLRNSSRQKSNPPPASRLPAVPVLGHLGSADLPEQELLRHYPLRRVGIAAAGVDGIDADVEDVPAAETPALEGEILQIRPPSMRR